MAAIEEVRESNFDEEELAFQKTLVDTDFGRMDVHSCLFLISSLIEQFKELRAKLWKDQEKRHGLLVQLQLLKAKNSFLMERCFSDPDALARFFFLHETITHIHDTLYDYQEPESIPIIEDISIAADDDSETEEFSEDFECSICYVEYSHSETYKFSSCCHRFCKQCLEMYYCNIINDGGDVCNIKCPESSCDEFVQDKDLRRILDEETMKKYEHFCFLAYIKNEPNSHWCPFPNCENVMIVEPDETSIRCDSCYRSSCIKCKTKWHHGMTCEEYQITKAPEDAKTQKWKSKHGVKSCPNCGQLTIRLSGCPDMLCSNCNTHWDWHSVGESRKETWIEKVGYYYPRAMKRVLGSRDVLEDWEKSKKDTALYLTPFMIGSTVLGVPLFCVTGPPAYITKRIRNWKQK